MEYPVHVMHTMEICSWNYIIIVPIMDEALPALPLELAVIEGSIHHFADEYNEEVVTSSGHQHKNAIL